MSDYGLGYFPIAGPKNSSFSLEPCHVVSFCIFCPWGYKSSTGSAEQRIEPLLPRHDGQTMIPISLTPLSNQTQALPQDSWLPMPVGYDEREEDQHQYNSNHANLSILPHLSISVGASTPWHSSQIWSAWHHFYHQSIYWFFFHLISSNRGLSLVSPWEWANYVLPCL